jgi:hypothetical protein
MGAAGTRLSLRPLFFEGSLHNNPGEIAPRDRERMWSNVIACDWCCCLKIESEVRITSPRLRGEVGAQRRVRGTLRESECVETAPHPTFSP